MTRMTRVEQLRSRLLGFRPTDTLWGWLGPLFFAVASQLDDVLDQFPTAPRVFILRMRLVPLIDPSGAVALRRMLDRCRRQNTRVVLTALQDQPLRTLAAMGIVDDGVRVRFADSYDKALETVAGS